MHPNANNKSLLGGCGSNGRQNEAVMYAVFEDRSTYMCHQQNDYTELCTAQTEP